MIKKYLLGLLLINNMVILGSESTCPFSLMHNFFTSIMAHATSSFGAEGTKMLVCATAITGTLLTVIIGRNYYCKFVKRISEKGWLRGFTEGYNKALSEIDEQHLADLEEVRINSFWAALKAIRKHLTAQSECSAKTTDSGNSQQISLETAFVEVLALFDKDKITECSLHVKQDDTEFVFGTQS